MSKPREPTSFYYLTIIVLTFCAVLALEADASITPPGNNQAKRETPEEVRKNEVLISKITYCRVLALNSNMPEQAKSYAVKLNKFDDFYHESKIFHAGQSMGFLKGILYQMGFPNPSKKRVKNVANELYFRQCDISF